MMENAYNEPELEKKPTASVVRPLKGHLTTVRGEERGKKGGEKGGEREGKKERWWE